MFPRPALYYSPFGFSSLAEFAGIAECGAGGNDRRASTTLAVQQVLSQAAPPSIIMLSSILAVELLL